MFKLTLFEALFLAHLMGDWFFQTKWQAQYKKEQWSALISHCCIYTICFLPVFFWYHLSPFLLVFIFLTHFIIDRRKFTIWWMRTIKKIKEDDFPQSIWFVLLIAVDQAFHLFVLGLITLFS